MTEFVASTDLRGYLLAQRERVDQALDRFLPAEDHYPKTLHQAMRYSVFAGGKRVRPDRKSTRLNSSH